MNLDTKFVDIHRKLRVLERFQKRGVGLNWLPMAGLGLLKLNNGHKMVNSEGNLLLFVAKIICRVSSIQPIR